MEDLAELAERFDLAGVAAVALLILARVTPVVALAPFLGGASLGAAVRGVVAASLVLALYPAASACALPAAPGAALLTLLALKEAIVGTALGLLSAVAFHALMMAGQLIDQARGASGASGELGSPLASLHLLLGVVLFLLVGGHRAFLAALAGSFEVIPLDQLPSAPQGVEALALLLSRLVGGALAAAVMLAAPAVMAILLADLTLGLLGRTAPQLGSYFSAMPLRAALGLVVALLTLSAFADELGPSLEGAVGLIERASEFMRAGP